MTKINVKLPLELEPILEQLSRESGKSAEEIALAALLERLEDYEDVKIAEERLRNPAGEPVPLEEVMAEFGFSPGGLDRKTPAAE